MKNDNNSNRTELLINHNPFETRVALVEQGRLVEFYVERAKYRGITGNIYNGKVVRVLPGMQSAFVEIGIQRTSFLHVSDIQEPELDDEEEEHKKRAEARIQDLIKEGQEVLVQAAKEPIGTKGARVTSYVSLPGRYLVFMPTYDKVAISRRIASDKERKRLREIVSTMRPPGCGFIIRTVCDGMPREDIQADMEFLIKLWNSIQKKKDQVRTPVITPYASALALMVAPEAACLNLERLSADSKEEYD